MTGTTSPGPKSLRKAGQRPTGGQKGHPGSTLRQVVQPDEIVTHEAPDQCQACRRPLRLAYQGEARQVFDLPTLAFKVTEHRVMQALCCCGQMHSGQFPSGVNAAVQYGPQALAAMVHLNQHHMLPVARTADLMADFFGLGVSEAIVLKACATAKEQLAPTAQAIAQALHAAPTVHADETDLRVGKSLHWMQYSGHRRAHLAQACRCPLRLAYQGEARQVFDLPTLKFKVTEHSVMQALCRCGQMHSGQFPSGINAAVQYGPQALAAMVHLSQHHMLPVARTADLMADFFGLGVSEAIVLKACATAKEQLAPTAQAIAQALHAAPIVHADETGLRVGKSLHWMQYSGHRRAHLAGLSRQAGPTGV